MKKKRVGQLRQEEVYDPIDNWYSKNLDIANRTLYFGTPIGDSEGCEVNDKTAQNLIKGLYLLNNIDHKSITIVWLSYGGDWNAGMAIYDVIKEIESSVTIKAYGRIRSMGSIILQAATKRLLSPTCEFLTHYGISGFEGTSEDHRRFVKEEQRNNDRMVKIYLERVREKNKGFSEKRLRKEFCEHDTYLTPEEAIELGLADEIISSRKKES